MIQDNVFQEVAQYMTLLRASLEKYFTTEYKNKIEFMDTLSFLTQLEKARKYVKRDLGIYFRNVIRYKYGIIAQNDASQRFLV